MERPHMIIKDRYFYQEIYTEKEEQDILDWLSSLGLGIKLTVIIQNVRYYELIQL